MSQALVEQVQKHRKEIKSEILTYAISEIIAMHRATPPEIQIQPDWQRLFRWNRTQQTAFIESLLLEVPIPPLFFFEEDDGRWQLLDGLQRVSTILKFMGTDSDVPLEHQGEANNDDDWHDETQNDITHPLQLLSAEYLTTLEGLSFARLPTPLRLNLKRARIQIYVLKRETDRIYKYEVFKRLNRGGSRLEDQELRNCAVRILDDRFANFIRSIAGNVDFLEVLQISEEDVRKGQADELALRFLTMKNYGDRFRHDVTELLTKYMEEVSKQTVAFDYGLEEQTFSDVWRVLARAYPDGSAFRARRNDGRVAGPFSPTQFEMISIAVASNLPAANRKTPADLKQCLDELVGEARTEGLTGAGSNSRKKTLGRIQKAREWLA